MKKIIARISLFVVASIIISMMLPREGLMNLSFNKGAKWEHETLYAPFDFSIYKSENQLIEERKDIQDKHLPVFTYDSIAATEILHQVGTKYNLTASAVDSVPESEHDAYGRRLIQALKFIYHKGVINDQSHLSDYIKIIESNNIYTVATDELFTISSAIDYLTKKMGHGVNTTLITPNVFYDKDMNTKMSDFDFKQISLTEGVVRKGEVVVSDGQIIDEATYRVLSSFRTAYERQIGSGTGRWAIDFGHILFVLLMLMLNYIFLAMFRTNYARRLNNLLFILFMYILMVSLTVGMSSTPWLNVYAIPFSVLGIFMLTFFDSRTAMFGLISVLLISAMAVQNPFQFVCLNFIAGMVGIFTMRHNYHRHNVFKAAGFIYITYALGYLALALLENGRMGGISWHQYIWFGVNVILMLAFYQLVYLFEKIFGFVSDITLLELCDTNQPLLQQLAEKAPGTFQHSLQVANLAESAAKEIGANPLLARTGALYHDIGKIKNPSYFIENIGGSFNPHSNLTPTESAAVIRQHVTDGLTIAKKHKLPSKIQEFILSHHGNSRIYYFYSIQKSTYGDDFDEADFTYPGPPPVSRELSICMMADAVEAASRTLKSFLPEDIEAFINRIIDTQIADKQLAGSMLSFNDIQLIKQVFAAKLNNIYHGRIEYPDRK